MLRGLRHPRERGHENSGTLSTRSESMEHLLGLSMLARASGSHKKRQSHLDVQKLVDDARYVHSFGSLPNWFYRRLLKQRPQTAPPHFAYGAAKARRREAAVATRCIMRDRVRRAGKSPTTSLYDVKSAFCSVDHAAIRDVYGGIARRIITCESTSAVMSLVLLLLMGMFGWHLGLEPLRVTVRPLMSSMGATCWPPVESYIGIFSGMNVELLAQSPVSDGIVNCSILFVDDLASDFLHSCHACLVGVVDVASRKLGAQLTPIGLAQDTDKAEVLPCLWGSKSKECMRGCMAGALKGAKKSVRYLGPLLYWDGSIGPEITKRICQASKAWFGYRSFWYVGSSLRFKLLVFRAIVFATLISGLAAFVLTGAVCRRLGSFLIHKARKLLGGRACKKRHRAHISSTGPCRVHRSICTLTLHMLLLRCECRGCSGCKR